MSIGTPGSLPESGSAVFNPAQDGGAVLDMSNLELLHHYTTVTYLSLTGTDHMEVWQIAIPKMAIQYPFLMHELLAVSALHMAYLTPSREDELLTKASRCEALALPSFRALTSDITRENCHAAFAFAGFIITSSLASARSLRNQDPILAAQGDLPHWLHLLRGIHLLLGSKWDWLLDGPFAPLVDVKKYPVPYTRNPYDHCLSTLVSLVTPSTLTPNEDREKLLVCYEALDELRMTSSLPFSPNMTLDTKSAVYIWPGRMSHEYLQLIRDREPEALVILAHYCVMLEEVDIQGWYLTGLARKMVESIDQILGPKWRAWIDWPLRHTGLKTEEEPDMNAFHAPDHQDPQSTKDSASILSAP